MSFCERILLFFLRLLFLYVLFRLVLWVSYPLIFYFFLLETIEEKWFLVIFLSPIYFLQLDEAPLFQQRTCGSEHKHIHGLYLCKESKIDRFGECLECKVISSTFAVQESWAPCPCRGFGLISRSTCGTLGDLAASALLSWPAWRSHLVMSDGSDPEHRIPNFSAEV